MEKLTKGQLQCMGIMARGRDGDGCMRAADTYRPTRKLVDLGLATRKPLRSALQSSLFEITDAGRAALADLAKKEV